ncbi:efflux transporter, outer membrane factor (OMF) lipoprotein, NodT family [Filimonas lacunae]|uniref:Efflux transporter, outer membrane factor (OMF) lipoprotein, NodT family n=1 Tax=Filimonas lacunae TaxID=477680 RepID=A0A173MDW5_9BACT|nr:efflux transporter outer membrane subunit [Filimonas lacunae]BAV05720.1 outer membrane protein OprM [Filimonas lacunae]SIT28798.1 efflux transporter, outer membrane factor (OMF) lipoprotein, NodT family [Filimonas lacunae]
MTNRYKQYSLAVLLAVAGFSCKVTQRYQRPNDLPVTATYRGSNSTDSATIANMPWKQLFIDPALQSLIQQGLDNNLDLKVAVARIKAADANLRQSKAAFLPSLAVDADYTRSKSSSAQLKAFGSGLGTTTIPTVNTYALTGTTSWEADVWGKLKSNKKAYVAALLQSEAYKRAVQTQLIADIATNYYALLAYDKQLEITQQTIDIRKKDIITVKELKTAATLTGADVVTSEANLYSAEVSVPDIVQNIRVTENAISLLLGAAPDSIVRSKMDDQTALAQLQTGVPVQLISNRPDVQQAEYGLINKFELTNSARTYFYPSLTITATGGWATANTLKGFFDGTFYGNLVGGLTQPIFNQGLNKQRLKVAEANQEEAVYTFKTTVLTAYQEVANALSSYQTAASKTEARTLQLQSLNKAVDYSKELLKFTSTTNYTDVLTAETNLLAAQISGISDKLQQLQAVVTLYRALGGGWK